MGRRLVQQLSSLSLVLIGLAACNQSEGAAPVEKQTTLQNSPGWTRLPAPPLSGRVGSLVATVGSSIVVVGGERALCPPEADCDRPDTEPYADGAAFDTNTHQWRAIADAPAGLTEVASAVVGDDIYALSHCGPAPTCVTSHALLRYRSKADAWDVLQGLDTPGSYFLVAMADGVVAYRSSDEYESGPDARFFAGDDRWLTLPDDPLPPVYDRFAVEFEGRLLLFGSDLQQHTKLAAAYDPKSNSWQKLPDSKSKGYQVWRAGSLLYLNPHFGKEGGGIFDPSTNMWRPLPELPTHDLSGVIGADGATYEYASGWVLDTRTNHWLKIEPYPDDSRVYDQVIAEAPALGLVVFGGQTWTTGEGQLLNDIWLWTPP